MVYKEISVRKKSKMSESESEKNCVCVCARSCFGRQSVRVSEGVCER